MKELCLAKVSIAMEYRRIKFGHPFKYDGLELSFLWKLAFTKSCFRRKPHKAEISSFFKDCFRELGRLIESGTLKGRTL